MANNIVSFKELRSRVLGQQCVQECTAYIDSLIFRTVQGYDTFYQEYCAYAYAMNIEYNTGMDAPACICAVKNQFKMFINPVKCFIVCESERDVLFIIAHEVSHVLFRHIEKYFNDETDELIQLFRNLTTDVEINEGLKEHVKAPKSCFDLDTFKDMISMDVTLDKDKLASDYLYSVLDRTCKNLLGYYIGEMLYLLDLHKVTFVEELIRIVLFDEEPVVLKVNKDKYTKHFCEVLLEYLDGIQVKIITGSKMHPGKPSLLSGNGAGSGNGGAFGEKDNGLGGCSGNNIVSGMQDCSIPELGTLLEALDAIKDVVMSNNGSVSTEGRGYGVSSVKTKVDYVRKRSQLPWQKLLENKAKSLSNEVLYTRRRINRRQPTRLELLGKYNKDAIDLVIAFDESGSIDNDELGYFISEFMSVLDKIECNVHFYSFAYGITDYRFYKDREKKKLQKVLKDYNRSQGGTSFQPVFRAIKENKKISKDCVLVVFTDGDGEEDVDFCGVKNRLWVLTTDKLSCKESKRNIRRLICDRGGEDYDY